MMTLLDAPQPTRSPTPLLDAVRPARAGHMVQLDALRAIAVTGVCLHHWLGERFLWGLPIAGWGVQLFFVLSGFLITGILLRARDRADEQGAGRIGVLRAFYVHRALRIWPLFYAALLMTAALNLRPAREYFWWNATFLTNVKIFLRGDLIGVVSHFWSLAVEEQFYLVWPWLMLLTPRRLLVPTMLTVVVLANAVQLWIAAHSTNSIGPSLLPTASVDTIVYGALLAYYRDHPGLDRVAALLGLGLGVPVLLLWVLLDHRDWLGPASLPIERLGLAFLLGWVILRAARGWRGPIGRVLEWRPLVWVGTISFGVYVIHNFPLTFLNDFVINAKGMPPRHFWGFAVPGSASRPLRSALAIPWCRVLVLGVATLMLSTLSFYLYERPLNGLKRFFPYSGKRPARRA